MAGSNSLSYADDPKIEYHEKEDSKIILEFVKNPYIGAKKKYASEANQKATALKKWVAQEFYRENAGNLNSESFEINIQSVRFAHEANDSDWSWFAFDWVDTTDQSLPLPSERYKIISTNTALHDPQWSILDFKLTYQDTVENKSYKIRSSYQPIFNVTFEANLSKYNFKFQWDDQVGKNHPLNKINFQKLFSNPNLISALSETSVEGLWGKANTYFQEILDPSEQTRCDNLNHEVYIIVQSLFEKAATLPEAKTNNFSTSGYFKNCYIWATLLQDHYTNEYHYPEWIRTYEGSKAEGLIAQHKSYLEFQNGKYQIIDELDGRFHEVYGAIERGSFVSGSLPSSNPFYYYSGKLKDGFVQHFKAGQNELKNWIPGSDSELFERKSAFSPMGSYDILPLSENLIIFRSKFYYDYENKGQWSYWYSLYWK